MKIHLKQIPAEGLHLQGEEDCPVPELAEQDIHCAGPLTYNLDLGISDGHLWANGSLSQPMQFRCVSCLEQFVHNIEVHAFALHTELKGPESVDLTPFMREDILLNLPPYPHCDREAGRKCKGAKSEYSNLEEQERDAKRERDWEALDKLKLKNG